MPLYYVTGNSGSGKSTVLGNLKRRGYTAYDTDDDGFAKWHNDQTGYVHPKSSIKEADRTPEFLSAHSWKASRREIEQLAKSSGAKDVFLCGLVYNDNEIWDLFTNVFALVVDDETLKYRLATRTNNNWGKQPHELQETLNRKRSANKVYKRFGYIIIDATQPIEKIVDEILSYVHER